MTMRLFPSRTLSTLLGTGQSGRSRAWLLAAALLIFQACGEQPSSPLPSTLVVNITSTGADIDDDGFDVVLDGKTVRHTEATSTVTFVVATAGRHTIHFEGVAQNCEVPGLQIVMLAAGQQHVLDLSLVCVPDAGAVVVTITTTGLDVDPDGYLVSANGQTPALIGANASMTIQGVQAGDADITLDGLRENCTVIGTATRTVNVTFKQTRAVAFNVSCAPYVGSVLVTTTTTGTNPDPNAYVATVGPVSWMIERNGFLLFTGVPVGNNTVTLGDVAAHCTVTPGTTVTAEVRYGEPWTTAAFTIAC